MKISTGILATTAAAMLALGAGASQASISTFSAQDDGAPTTGPWPNSTAEEALFLPAAATFGPVRTETFEELPVGYSANFSITGASVALTGPNFGEGFSGISNTTNGNLYGFNITTGGANWLGFAGGTATFTFTHPSNSFGFYTTGVQTVFTSSLTVSFNDGTSQTLSLPINVSGGASYFGFTDTSSFSSVTISNVSNDAWGIDNVSFNASAIPEPAEWALMLVGVALVGATLRRSRRQVVGRLV